MVGPERPQKRRHFDVSFGVEECVFVFVFCGRILHKSYWQVCLFRVSGVLFRVSGSNSTESY